jgi:phytoene synthase
MNATSPEALARAASASSFAAGMRILPAAERAALYAIYGFCRLVDDIADDQQMPREQRAGALGEWRVGLAGLYAGGDAGLAAFLAPAVAHFGLAEADFVAVIDGMQMDVEADIRAPSFAVLDLYCDRVASAVGRLCVRVFGMAEAEGLALSHHLGRALQLTNILRDIDEDAGIGRLYLPAEALAAGGIDARDPLTVVGHAGVDMAARWLVPHARAHFAAARAILAARPRGRLLAPVLMAAGYDDVLDRLEARGWAAPRARVRTRKLAMLVAGLRYGLGL